MARDRSRKFEWNNQHRPKATSGIGIPIRGEGSDGDMQVRQTTYGAKLFAKLSGEWLSTFLSTNTDVLTIRDNKGQPTISLNSDGSASFGSTIDVGSNLKITGHLGLLDFQGANENICIGNSNNRPMGNLTESASYSDNTAIGDNTMATMNQGTNNISIGNNSLANMVAGVESSYNVAIGVNALKGKASQSNTRAHGNTAIGPDCMGNCHESDGSSVYPQFNVAIGRKCLYIADGDYNVAVGFECGDALTTGSDNIFIGKSIDPAAADQDQGIGIGDTFTVAANDFSFGKTSNVVTNDFDADAAWTRASDERLKKDITNDTLGLSFINDLRPVTFKWKPSNEVPEELTSEYNVENQKNLDVTLHGLIAQEVKSALDTAGVSTFGGWKLDKIDGKTQRISREMFVTPLIKAVQELSAKIDSMQIEINNLKDS